MGQLGNIFSKLKELCWAEPNKSITSATEPTLNIFLSCFHIYSCLNFHGSNGNGTLEKTKHGTWLLTIVLRKVIPNLDNLEACHDYLRDLGAKHQQHGVRREHLDLMALVYCSAIRGVVATQGKFSIFEIKLYLS